jgi:hypothetical protein
MWRCVFNSVVLGGNLMASGGQTKVKVTVDHHLWILRWCKKRKRLVPILATALLEGCIQLNLRPCVINSMFRVPRGHEIHARALQTQHKLDFQYTVHFYWDVCWNFVLRIFTILKNRWAIHFPLVMSGELSGQNRCASGTQNIISNTHGLRIQSNVALNVYGKLSPN